jgi:putative transposase
LYRVTQRGNRRVKTFFSMDDYRYYLGLVAEAKTDAGVEVWAYCLMPNHVHLVVVPDAEDGLASLKLGSDENFRNRKKQTG